LDTHTGVVPPRLYRLTPGARGSLPLEELALAVALESYGPLVLGHNGTPHAVYMGNELRHARRQPDATWASERIDDAGYRPSVAVDGRGYFHVAYVTPLDAPAEVYYATNASGGWVATTLWSEGPVDLETAVAADSTGTPRSAIGFGREGRGGAGGPGVAAASVWGSARDPLEVTRRSAGAGSLRCASPV
jgi:hypothetical protein